MRRLFELYQRARSPRLLAKEWRSLATNQRIIDAFLRMGALKRNPVASRYPCGAARENCGRRLLPARGRPETPWLAQCCQNPEECLPVYLTDEQVEEFELSHEEFARALRSTMGLEGPFSLLDSTFMDTVHLGTLHAEADTLEVFLSVGRFVPLLRALLTERANAARGSIVFVPTNLNIPVELVHRYGPGGKVVLGFLADVLEVRDRGLVLRPAFEALLGSRADPAPGCCMLYDHSGVREITQREAEAVGATPNEYDLFVDTFHLGADGRYGGGFRDLAGQFKPVALPRDLASCLADLVQRGKPVRPGDLVSLRDAKVKDPVRLLQRARKLVDVREGPRWRSIRMVRGAAPGQQLYVFRPPPGLRYAVLIPLGGATPRPANAKSARA